MTTTLKVSEFFHTLQGEGASAGQPSSFLRLAGCNRGRKTDMGCRFCDTAFQFALGKKMSFSEIEMEMQNKLAPRRNITTRPMVVITGGEPMMQHTLPAFCHYLKYNKWPGIQIESNGDRLQPGLPDRPYLTLVVSPKASRAQDGTYEYKEPNPSVYDRADCFKFLVETETGSPYGKPPGWADVSGRPVYLSPITHYARPVQPGECVTAWNHRLVDVPRTRSNYTYAAELAMLGNYRLSMQQHLFYGVP